MDKHISVLLKEVIDNLNIKEDGIYVDATLGYGGHSSHILKQANKGYLYAFDKDTDAIEYATKRLNEIGTNYKIFNQGFINIKETLNNEGIASIDGILFDLGISSAQIDEEDRGFSYMKDAKLDMRMNKNQEKSAYEVVNTYEYEELVKIFRIYGEEKYAGKIAKRITEQRPIETTFELVDIISSCYPYKDKRNGHPAKKVFQAIRIEVNNELGELETALKDSLELLKPNGIITVITFHSLEDRIVKNIFKKVTTEDPILKGMPNIDPNLLPDYKLITNKPILPSAAEISNNKRAKSAKLRVIKRIK